MSGSKGLIDKKVTELVSEIYNRVDGRGVLAGSALAEALEIADAALRRAKAEVWREVRNEFDSSAVGLSLDSVEGSSNTGDYYAAGHSDAYREVIRWIDARAAQIEEGE